MAYVEENKVYNTVYGKLKNNNKMKQIQRENKALFQFSISEVTVDDGVLSVVCDAVTGDTINYTLDLSEANAELPAELYNLTTGGNVGVFLALVWRLYTSTLDSTGEQVDAYSIEQFNDLVAELEQARETITELTPADTTVSASPLLDIDLTGAYIENGTNTAIYTNNDTLSSLSFYCYIPVTIDNFNDYNSTFARLAGVNIEFIGAKLNNTDITNTLYLSNSWSYGANEIYYSFNCSIGSVNIPVSEEDYTVELTIKNKQTNKTITITAEIDHTSMKFKQ